MAYPAAVQAVLDAAGVKTLEEWNAAMSRGTAGGVNAVQRAAGHDLSEGNWTSVADPIGDAARAEQAQQRILAERRAGEDAARWAAAEAAATRIDMSVPSVWNPTPTNYNPDAAAVQASNEETARRLSSSYEPGAGLTIIADPVSGLPTLVSMNSEAATTGALQVLEERRSGIPIRAIDDMGGYAEFTTQPAVIDSVAQPEEAMSLLGSIASGVGNFISGGAKALLESRRDTPQNFTPITQQDIGYVGLPQAVPGMPSYTGASQASLIPWGAIGQTIGKAATIAGTAITGYQAGQAVLNAGGRTVSMGGIAPKKVNRATLVCPPKWVLGADGNCYPKAMLPRSARKWTPDPKPVVSRSDQKAITRAAAAKKRLVKLTNAAGAHATITRPHRHTSSSKKK